MQGPGTDLPRSRRTDQQEIEQNIDSIHRQADPHGRPRVAGCPQNRSKQDTRHPEQHRCADDGKIDGCVVANGFVRAKPYRKEGADHKREEGHGKAKDQNKQQ